MVNDEIIKIKCPWCNAVLSVKNRPDIETKNVTCPVCKQKSAFTQFTLLTPPSSAVPQQPAYQQPNPQPAYQQPAQQPVYQQPAQQPVYQQPVQQPVYQQPMQQAAGVGNPYSGTIYQNEMSAPGNSMYQVPASAIGQLVLMANGITYPLHQGRNVVGRKSPGSISDVQIDTGASRRMSRQHIIIDVEMSSTQGPNYTVSLYKPDCNAVLLNGQALMYGDRVIMSQGTTIEMPDAVLRFQLPDPEKTIL